MHVESWDRGTSPHAAARGLRRGPGGYPKGHRPLRVGADCFRIATRVRGIVWKPLLYDKKQKVTKENTQFDQKQYEFLWMLAMMMKKPYEMFDHQVQKPYELIWFLTKMMKTI